MKQPVTANEIGLSIAYTFILLILFVLIDIGFIWLLNNIILDLFNWFNQLSILWKLFILVVGGGTVLGLCFYACSFIANLCGYLIFKHFPTNGYTLIIGTIIGISNIVFLVIKLWQLPTHFNFWVIVELLFLSFVAVSFATVARTKKEYEEG